MIQSIIDHLEEMARSKALNAAYGAGAANASEEPLEAIPPKARNALFTAGEVSGLQLAIDAVRAIFPGESPATKPVSALSMATPVLFPKKKPASRKPGSQQKKKRKPEELMVPIGKLFQATSDWMAPRDVIVKLGWNEAEVLTQVIQVLNAARRTGVLEHDRLTGRYRTFRPGRG